MADAIPAYKSSVLLMEPTLIFPILGIRFAVRQACAGPLLWCCLLFAIASQLTALQSSFGQESNSELLQSFIEQNCLDCHQGDGAEGQLDFDELELDLSSPLSLAKWTRVHDRVRSGEMPPPDYGTPEPEESSQFTQALANAIDNFEKTQVAKLGRVQGRRLTRLQVERSLHQLLGIDIPLVDYLPAESSLHRYSTVSDGQAMSHFQMQSHLEAVDIALDEAFQRALRGDDLFRREFNARQIARSNPRRRCREPEMREGQAVIWNGGTAFYGRLPAAAAPADGWYRFKLTVSSLKAPNSGGVWSTVRTGLCVSSAPLLVPVISFEATSEPKDVEFTTWLPKGHMLEVRPGDATLKSGRFAGGQIGTGEGEPQNIPGIAFDGLLMEQIHLGPTDDGIRKLLFGDLELKKAKRGRYRIVTDDAESDAQALLMSFAERAFRGPVEMSTLRPYLAAVQQALQQGQEFSDAIRLGYRAILCSPRFLYLVEEAGSLNQYEIATRLSYFLTGGPPDKQLVTAAKDGTLSTPEQLRKQTDRILDAEGVDRFVRDFAGEWLELNRLLEAPPNRKLYRDYDNVVAMTMREETESFLTAMIRDDDSVVQLVNGKHTFVNSRLARYYELEDVPNDGFERVSLAPTTHRTGILTHGAILRVSANGTDTSPVLRGVWVSERLLGVHVPPPPDNVPAIEPDIRGATTIREQLLKHRADAACASCHSKVDPAGFALENFDAAGKWREYYNARRKKGPEIDASYQMPDGQEFADIDEFQSLIASHPEELARCVAENLLVYGTGKEISFSDRKNVDAIVEQVADNGYGFRSIIHQVVNSPIFLNK